MMRTLLSVFVVLGLVACSHDDKPAATSPDVAQIDAGASIVTPVEVDAGATDRACDAVRCRGGMVCKIVDGKPACVTQ